MLDEVRQRLKSEGERAFDNVLGDYLLKLHRHTGRNVILYATRWAVDTQGTNGVVSITEGDLYGFMEAIHGLKTKELDLILHSPGGSAESAEAIASYIRSKFDDIRVIIPHAAMSAATMLACASNCLVMGKHSFLGPTDPQIPFPTRAGVRYVSAQFIINEFQKAEEISKNDPGKLAAWIPLLNQYTPGLIEQCINSQKLSEKFVQKYLPTYMFAQEHDAEQRSKKISEILSSASTFHSHGRHISREECKNIGLKIIDLEADQEFQDLALSVFHATNIIFHFTRVGKITKNHLGNTVIRSLPTRRPGVGSLSKPTRA